MKKISFLQQASIEEREVVEKLLQSISFVDNRNTVTKFLTSFEQVIWHTIIMILVWYFLVDLKKLKEKEQK